MCAHALRANINETSSAVLIREQGGKEVIDERWTEGCLDDVAFIGPGNNTKGESAHFQEKILSEADAAAGSGNIGELLRREGIYSSTLTRWRRKAA